MRADTIHPRRQALTTFLQRLLGGTIAAVATLTATGAAMAQAYPSKPVKIVVPYTPGGTNDLVARILAQKLQEQMGQTVIVDNKPGASGNTGIDGVARSAADGYTVGLITTGHSIHPSLYPKLPYSLKTDLAPVVELTSGPMLVMVNPGTPYKTVKDLVTAAKAKPGAINYGSAGNGSTTHLSTELLGTMAGVKFNHIPYNGSAPAMTDAMAGNVDLVMDLIYSALPNVKSGRLRAIAISGAQRSPVMPEVPTVAESGVPGFEAYVWNGLVVPAGTPKDVVARLNAEVKKAMATPEIKERITAQGFAVTTGTPEEFGKVIADDMDRWAKVVKASGAKID